MQKRVGLVYTGDLCYWKATNLSRRVGKVSVDQRKSVDVVEVPPVLRLEGSDEGIEVGQPLGGRGSLQNGIINH